MSSIDVLELLAAIVSTAAAVTILRLRRATHTGSPIRPNVASVACAGLALLFVAASLPAAWFSTADKSAIQSGNGFFAASGSLALGLALIFALVAAACVVPAWLRQYRRLRDNTSQFQAVLAKAPIFSVLVDDSGTVVEFAHDADPDSLWFPSRNIVGACLWTLPGVQEDFAAWLRVSIAEAMAGNVTTQTNDFESLRGRLRRFEITVSPMEASPRGQSLAHIAMFDRSERITHEQELAEAARRYRGLILTSPDAIACVEYESPGISPKWDIDTQIDAFYEGTLIICNDHYARLLGHKHSSELIGLRMKQLLPRTQAGIEFITGVIDSGYRLSGWDSILRRDSTDDVSTLHPTSFAAEFDGDHLTRGWVVYRDISERLKEIDTAALGAGRRASLLRAKEAYFCFQHDPAIDTSLSAVEQAEQMRQARLVECNVAYARLVGSEKPDDIIGLSLPEIIPRGAFRDQAEAIRQRQIRFVENGYALEDDRRDAERPDGTPFITFLNSRGVLRHGQLTHHWGLLLDVSEKEAGERELRRSEARFERMAENSPALIYRIRMEKPARFDFVNDAIRSISGHSRDVAMSGDVVLSEVFCARNLELLLTQIEVGSTDPVLTRHHHRDERLIYLEHRVVPVRNAAGELHCIEGVALDVTESIASQRQLQAALNHIRELKDQLQIENSQLRHEIRSARGFDLIVGRSRPMLQAVELAAKAAPTDTTVLILGETGTGKELFARSIHKSSSRCTKPMISVNCAALPPQLIESELFGHARGAFTGANATRVGRFEAADGGTLFLDEVGEMPADLQAKLLRVVQEGTFERLGDSRSIKVDVRLIAATNKDLTAAVERGEFRADLFYRLNVFPIVIPPLRSRIDDIPLLANHFATKFGFRLNKRFDSLSPVFLRELTNHNWPGNVRELEAVIERSMIVSTDGTLQPVEFLSERQRPNVAGLDELERAAGVFDRGLHEAERHHILHALRQTNWVIEGPDGAATRLGIAPSTLRSRMKKLGIRRPHQIEHGETELKRRQLH